jgi:hypothetical protein
MPVGSWPSTIASVTATTDGLLQPVIPPSQYLSAALLQRLEGKRGALPGSFHLKRSHPNEESTIAPSILKQRLRPLGVPLLRGSQRRFRFLSDGDAALKIADVSLRGRFPQKLSYLLPESGDVPVILLDKVVDRLH